MVSFSDCSGRTSWQADRRDSWRVHPILVSMDIAELEQLVDQPLWMKVLETYNELIIQAGQERLEDEQGTRWASRIISLDETDADELSWIHGQLIAYGWLTFQLEGREEGLLYRITSAGKKASEQARKLAEQQEEVAA
ncbi:hypothetical protein [Thalassoglobus sp.]|uniref:hypothetical protein n=1 Tax=Thalassoglobus sp. TaxID=2795869 RepID=UPI003AA988CF